MTIFSQSLKKNKHSEAGFTLVELAVVMIIIGILIGGVLKGQEMITNARVTSTAAQMQAIGAAKNAFFDTYNALAGDMRDASTRLENCTAAPCGDGNGNAQLSSAVGAVPALASENTWFFIHLLRGNFITGLDATNNLAFGKTLPTAPIGGGFTVGDAHIASGGGSGFVDTELQKTVYLVQTGNASAAVGSNSGVMNPAQAARIDRKLDDGVPSSGGLVAQGGAADCRDATGSLYDEKVVNRVCAIAYKLN